MNARNFKRILWALTIGMLTGGISLSLAAFALMLFPTLPVGILWGTAIGVALGTMVISLIVQD